MAQQNDPRKKDQRPRPGASASASRSGSSSQSIVDTTSTYVSEPAGPDCTPPSAPDTSYTSTDTGTC